MKKAFLILGIAAVAMAVSCNRDELKVNGDDTLTGHKAYLVVNIHDAGADAATRATSPGFEYGSSDEYAVKDAYFYFYDEEGVFVSQATVWDGGTATESVEGEDDGNIEFKSNTVIVLNNLTSNTYPKYVVTVLNKPADFAAPEYLDNFPSTLSDAESEGIMLDTSNYTNFVMSTSSYYADASTPYVARDPYYFVTQLVTSNFSLEPIEDTYDDIVPVDIYVERLAAKVQVGTSLTAYATGVTIYSDAEGTESEYTGQTLYEIEATVAGDENPDEGGTPDVGDEKLYVALFGWALDATARHSNIVKEIDYGTWGSGSTAFNFTWNDSGNYRSYWGKSFNYGKTGADSALKEGEDDPNTDSDEKSSETWLNDYLKYVSLDDSNLHAIYYDGYTGEDYYTYCAENTNTAGDGGVITNRYSSAITDVLLKAVVCQYDSENDRYYIANLVRYHGVLYEESAFLNYVLGELTKTGSLNAYYDTGNVDDNGDKIYSHIDASYVHLENYADGTVVIKLNDSITTTLYSHDYNSSTEEYEMNEITEYTDIVEALADFCDVTSETSTYDANGYNGGLMYYAIPIQHLNNTYATDGTVAEANYGIVRNHWYKLTITELENIGKGIYDPNEVIVPNPGDDETFYYVGARINILSWHVVEQNPTL